MMSRATYLPSAALLLSPFGFAQVGTTYCTAAPNSTGAASVLTGSGSSSLLLNDLTLLGSSLPPGSFGYLLTSLDQAFVAQPGGSSGNLCLAGSIGRYVGGGQIQNTGVNGEFSLALDLTMTPQPTGFVSVASGETWNFQAWYRDAIGGQATSNFTNGLSVGFN